MTVFLDIVSFHLCLRFGEGSGSALPLLSKLLGR
jgi:hypothetical protein